MAEITNANDVEVILSANGTDRGTRQDMGRIVVDEFSITTENDDSLVSGVGFGTSVGISEGDTTHQFSFTMMGDDVDTFEIVAGGDGQSERFDMTARKLDGESVEWEFALQTCKAQTEELSGSSGDTLEYAVDGIAVGVDKVGRRSDASQAWE